MKINILGAGAMGLLYASYLCENNDVTLIERREENVSYITSNGVNVTRNGVTNNYKIKIVQSGTILPPCSLFIVFVKNTSTEVALKDNLSSISSSTAVLTLQNGYGSSEIIKKYVPKEQIYVGISKHNSLNLGNGNIEHTAVGTTSIGTDYGNKETLKEIVNTFNQSNLETLLCENVNYLIFEKLVLNASTNALTALFNTTFKSLLDDKYAYEVLKNIIKECILVLDKIDIHLDMDEELEQLKRIFSSSIGGKSSMCQDINNARLTEIDFINGAITSLGDKFNIDTPYNDMIVSLIHFKEDLVIKK